MSVDSTTSSTSSPPPSPPILSLSINFVMHSCSNSTVGIFSITTFTIMSILFLLPLYIFILSMGLQRWQQQASNTTISHSDVLTYHMVLIELLGVVGSTLMCCGLRADLPQTIMVGYLLLLTSLSGQGFFHILTCVERYLAVIHPITYLSLRTAKGIRIRNVAIGCVWLTCFAATGLMSTDNSLLIFISYYWITSISFALISFCSLSVLCVLIRPGPGEGGGDRRQVDHSKLRAFYTITAILGALMFRFGTTLVAAALYVSTVQMETEKCGFLLSFVWFGLPSSLVLPLLFLHRAGKLLCCKNHKDRVRSESGM